MLAVWTLIASFFATGIFVGASTLMGRLFGLRPETVSLGAGPTPFVFSLGGYDLRIGPVVFAGAVQFSAKERGIEDLPLWQQVMLHLTGPIALLLVAMSLAGPEILNLAVQAAMTLVSFSLTPLDHDGAFRTAFSAYALLPPPHHLASVLAVYAALNLLPVAILPGGAALATLAQGLGLSREGRVFRTYLLASLVYLFWVVLTLGALVWRLFLQGEGLA